jgi:Flp pilus assembly protein TadD
VSICRELVAIDPARYRPDLATSLANLGIMLSELGRPATALGPVGEAVTICCELAAASPGYRRDLARALSALAAALHALGRDTEAERAEGEAAEITQELEQSHASGARLAGSGDRGRHQDPRPGQRLTPIRT